MQLAELLPALHNLPRPDKFRAVQFLTAELAQGEDSLTSGAEYPVWSPNEAHSAATTLSAFLKDQAPPQ
ncbi:hypothetical protein LBMAG56_33150 [Verrucomicrobiota bacterium]|nr:hypothetical protein LBMAG56_33150 [Verrucomicrobiota bacterium]